MKKVSVCLACLVLISEGAHLPPSFKKCDRKTEPDLKKCMLEAAQNAVPQLTKAFPHIGIPSLDPLKIEKASIKAGTGSVAIDQNFRNCDFYGFEKVKIDVFDMDFANKWVIFEGTFPEITMKCQYELDGKVLLLPVKGEGDSVIVLKNLITKAKFYDEEMTKKGKTYVKFVSGEISQLDPELISFNFQNLFNGDKALGDNINKVLNENWKEVFEDVKGDYIQLINQIVVNLLNNFFMKVSIEEALD